MHVYELEIDEAKQRIALSLLPKDKLDARDAAWAKQRENYRKNGKNNRGNNRNNRNSRSNKPEKKQVTMEDATAALLARFGSKH